jgi:ubiquinone/menaquinone biosynthesis C-methylase UbiE
MPYSTEDAKRFNWSSVSGELLIDRVTHLKKFIIGLNILDAGCGGGSYSHFLSEQGFYVTGIDLHENLLKIARDNKAKGIFIQADILDLPFEDNQFDSSFCFDVLEHIDDVKALQELARVTSKRIILTVPQKDEHMQQFGLTFKTYQDPTHLRYYTQKTLAQLCQILEPEKIKIVCEGYISGHAICEYLIDFDKCRSITSDKKTKVNTPKRIVKRIYGIFIKKLLGKVFYKQINIGLAAIIDL